MTTMKEVAEYASVSIATVSRVINKTGYVSPDLEERVHDAMRTLNYQPSALARSLRRQETLTIGVLVPQLDHPFFSALAFAIERALFESGYRTLICSAEEDREKERAYVDMLIQQRVDGVIFVPTGQSTENLRRMVERTMPVVLVDRNLEVPHVDRILSSNYDGAYQAMSYLLELGHRNIGIIGGPTYSESMMMRIQGVKDALTAHHVELQPELMVIGEKHQFEMGYDTAIKLLEGAKTLTAIFALTDVMAIGVLHAAAKLDLHLPKELSVMGFDNIPLAAYSIPGLTTVAQPIYEMGQVAAEVLLKRIQNYDQPFQTITLDTKMIVRKSVTPVLEN